MTLHGRLTVAFLAVVLGPVLIGVVIAGGTVAAVGNARAADRLNVAATTVRASLGIICSELRSAAEAAAERSGGSQPEDVLRSAEARAQQVVERHEVTSARVDKTDGSTGFQTGDAPGPWTLCTDSGPSVGRGTMSALAWRAALRDNDGKLVGYLLVARPVDANLMERLADEAGAEITVLDNRESPLSTLSSDRAKRNVQRSRGLGRGEIVESDDRTYLFLVRPTAGQPLRLLLSTKGDDEQNLFALLLAVVVGAGLLALVAAWWLARATTRPVVELATAADRVAGGDLDVWVPVRSGDELGRLATTFNRMTREMRGYVQALTASRDQLRGNLALLGDTLSSTHDLDRILKVILETAMAATGARAGVVLLVEQPDGRRSGGLVGRCGHGLAERADGLEKIRLQLGEGLLGAVAASGEPRRGRVAWDGPTLSPREPRCRTYVAVPFSGARHTDGEEPLAGPGRLLGVLALYDRLGHDDFDDADLITLRTFAGQVAVAVENVLLHEETHRLSLTDPLTGLWNYRYLKESLRREVKRAGRFQRKLAVLAMDLDRFKEVNDTYGHAVGDAVLFEFARRVKKETREVDLAFRHGGDEFVVLLPETDVRGSARVAERLCAAIRDAKFEFDGDDGRRDSITVTISAGVAVFPEHGGAVSDVLEAADDALYAAKAAGRDTWHVAPMP